MQTRKALAVPMRDGIALATDLYLPETASPVPVILMRTPYGRERFSGETLYSHPERFVDAGYALAVQDCRGTGDSAGVLDLNARGEHDDGYDAVEWLAAQPFCNGRVGMYGLSYFGFTQLAAAGTRPPHLRAACPFMTVAMEPFGASRMHTTNIFHLFWAYGQLLGRPERFIPDPEARARLLPLLQENQKHLGEWISFLPMDENPAAQVEGVSLLKDFIDLQRGIESREFWKSLRLPLDFDRVHAPLFFGTGWLDVALSSTLDAYRAARESADEYTRESARLLIGPWPHGGMLPGSADDVSFGPGNDGESQGVDGMMLRFFDHYLKDQPAEPFPARVRYFITGSNVWREAADWPPASRPLTLSLAPGFALSEAPVPAPHADSYRYDPRDPAPSAPVDEAGRGLMPDWRRVSERRDVLTYRTAPYVTPLTIAGEVTLRLFARSSAPDTDFVCRLLDIAPDGRETEITAGLLRAKYRFGMFDARPLTPGQTVEYRIGAGSAAHTFLPGHALAIHVASAMFPKHNRNLNTGKPAATTSEMAVADQTILLGGDTPSQLILPVID